jgi:hypothetical protein
MCPLFSISSGNPKLLFSGAQNLRSRSLSNAKHPYKTLVCGNQYPESVWKHDGKTSFLCLTSSHFAEAQQVIDIQQFIALHSLLSCSFRLITCYLETYHRHRLMPRSFYLSFILLVGTLHQPICFGIWTFSKTKDYLQSWVSPFFDSHVDSIEPSI